MSHRRIPQTIDVIRRGLFEAAPHDHSQTVSNPAVAWRAIYVVTLLPAQDDCFIDGDRECLNILARGVFTFVKRRILIERAAGDGSIHRLPLAASIGEKFAWALRPVLGLILHIESGTTSQRQAQQDHVRNEEILHRATSAISSGPRLSRKPAVNSRSKFGSSDSLHRKNLLREASANRSTLNTG